MNPSPALAPAATLTVASMLAVPEHVFVGRDLAEELVDSINREAPAAERRITAPTAASGNKMHFAAVPFVEDCGAGSRFMVETQIGFGLDVHTHDTRNSPEALSLLLPLAGSVRMQLRDGEFTAETGAGLVIDPNDVEFAGVQAGTHFVEFNLPKSQLLRLGAELHPGAVSARPRFAPVLPPALSQRLMFIALQAARTQLPDAAGATAATGQVMFRRWIEMLALSLLDEQPLVGVRGQPAARDAGSPASLRRALDFIEAHAHTDIGLADIAGAAFVSGSSLLRLFHEHLSQTPAAFLRQVRLDRAREELRGGTGGPIREVAQRWGFQNASKFSQAYLRRFGELPSDSRLHSLR